jgi:hypothetical protein
MPRNLDITIRYAFIRFKRKMALSLALWFIALLLGVSLIIASQFIYNNPILKIWSVILVIVLFIKLAYDTGSNMNREYREFKVGQ